MSESQWTAAENALEEAIKAGNTDLSSTIASLPQEIVDELVPQLFAVVHSNPLDYGNTIPTWNSNYPNCRFPTFLRKLPHLSDPNDLLSFLRNAYNICLNTLKELGHTVTPEGLCARRIGIFDWEGDSSIPNVPDRDQHLRVDMMQHNSVAIDAADTNDVDDAVFWDEAEQRVFVHITDPLRYFPEGLPKHYEDEIQNKILNRAMSDHIQTVYTPAKIYHLFPIGVIRNYFSLDAEHFDGSAMTFSFEFDGTTLKDGSIRVEMSRIKKPTRMTYDQVNELVEAFRGNQDLSGNDLSFARMLDSLCHVSEKLKELRRGRGASFDYPQGFKVEVKNSVTSVALSNRDGLSSRMVEELMIWANRVAGEFGKKAGVPLPYRNQRSQRAVKLDTSPDVHVGIGLSLYCPVTSPMRRSADLLGHNQLKCALRGETPLSVEEVKEYFPSILSTVRSIKTMEKRLKQYWLYEHFRAKEGPLILKGLWKWGVFYGPFGLSVNNVYLPEIKEAAVKIIYVFASYIPVSVRVTYLDPVTEVIKAEFHEHLSGANSEEYSNAAKFVR